MIRPHPLQAVRALREKTDAVIVAFSRGRDALATLDLCKRYFPRVEAFFGFMVPGLEFEERGLRYAERRWGITIHRLPHWFLSSWIKDGTYRIPHADASALPSMGERDIFDHARLLTGMDWVVTGRKADDSLWRRSTCANQPDGIFAKRREAWPLVWWTNQAVHNYLKRESIPLPGDYLDCGDSHGALNAKELIAIRKRWPADYDKITAYFPYIGVEVARAQFRERWASGEPVPEAHDPSGTPAGPEEGPVQPAHH